VRVSIKDNANFDYISDVSLVVEQLMERPNSQQNGLIRQSPKGDK
jgi:hypothetical protein